MFSTTLRSDNDSGQQVTKTVLCIIYLQLSVNVKQTFTQLHRMQSATTHLTFDSHKKINHIVGVLTLLNLLTVHFEKRTKFNGSQGSISAMINTFSYK